jgi:threonine synthase
MNDQAHDDTASGPAYLRSGSEVPVPVPIEPTIAEGISVVRPPRFRQVLAALRGSGGGTVAVSEAAIATARHLLSRTGFYVEPTSAAAAAGLSELLATGRITSGRTTVLLLTGSGLKATARIAELLDAQA